MISRLLVLSIAGLLSFAALACDDVSNVASTVDNDNLLMADNPRSDRRKDRRGGRQDHREDKQDCRQEEGLVGHDKRECKREDQERIDGDDDAEAQPEGDTDA